MLFIVPKKGGYGYHTGPHGEAPGFVRGQRSKRKAWAQAFIVVSVGKARQGRGSRFRIG